MMYKEHLSLKKKDRPPIIETIQGNTKETKGMGERQENLTALANSRTILVTTGRLFFRSSKFKRTALTPRYLTPMNPERIQMEREKKKIKLDKGYDSNSENDEEFKIVAQYHTKEKERNTDLPGTIGLRSFRIPRRRNIVKKGATWKTQVGKFFTMKEAEIEG